MTEKNLGRLSICARALLISLTAIHAIASWKNYSALDATSGVWKALYAGSEGRVFDIFRLCSSGGAALTDILKAPKRLVVIMSYNDIGALMSLVLGLACAIRFSFENLHRKWTYFFFFALGMNVFIYGSPGTNYNQLIDMHVASILLCGSMYFLAKNGLREFRVSTVTSALIVASFWIIN